MLVYCSFIWLGTLIDGEPIIKLPPKLINLKKIYFSPEEREFYSNLEADSRQKFKVIFIILKTY